MDRFMHWYIRETSIAGIQIPNRFIVLGAAVIVMLLIAFMRLASPVRLAAQSLRRAISRLRWFSGISYSSIALLIALCSSGWSKTMPINWAGVPRM
jgi:hypothetical protein